MRVATKIATGSGLLVLLFAGVLAYYVQLGRESASRSEDLSNQVPRAGLIAAQQATLVTLDKQIQRMLAIQDPDYLRGIRDQHSEFEKGLAELTNQAVGPEVRRDVQELKSSWKKYLGTWEPIDQAGSLDLRNRNTWDGIFDRLSEVKAKVDVMLDSARISADRQAQQSRGSKEEVEQLSGKVLLLALVLCVLIVAWTVRSINVPLRRLVDGTRAVAGGHFDYRLDLGKDEEFSRLAASFNAMVRRLSELDQMKKEFVAHVSHELKNPLVAMQETNQLLVDELAGPLNPKQQRLLELNIESGRRLSAMLSNLLDLSSLEAGAMSYEFKPEDLGDIARFAASVYEARAAERKVGITLKVPDGTEPVVAPADRDRLIQVLENLLGNALKFSPPGSDVELEVRPAGRLPAKLPRRVVEKLGGGDRRFAWLSVADRGPGVPDEHKEAIFRKFHQVGHNARTNGGGVGLGLAICRELVEAHDGAIWVMDRSGGGSVFCVALPGAEAHAVREPDRLRALGEARA